MARCGALYSHPPKQQTARADVELDGDSLVVIRPDGRWQRLRLDGSSYEVRDAAHASRFVQLLLLRWPDTCEHLITPPEIGAIAPRAAGVPSAPADAVVVDQQAWAAIVDWVRGRGRLGGRSVTELARLACIATAAFANVLGEMAAKIAAESAWEGCGPMRGGANAGDVLRPLEDIARTSERAATALLAARAMLMCGVLRLGR